MSKFIQALLSGVFFTFILDFFLFLGIKQNYIDTKEIPVYYNILFADNQNIFIFLIFSILIGYLTIYISNKTTIVIIGVMFMLTFSTLIPSIGESVGSLILQKKDVTIKNTKYTYHGDIYYIGRNTLYMYDYRFKKVLYLDKQTIKGEY